MSFSLAPLLMHSDALPAGARAALKASYEGSPGERRAQLEMAAHIIYETYGQTDLECSEVRELVGLPPGCGC